MERILHSLQSMPSKVFWLTTLPLMYTAASPEAMVIAICTHSSTAGSMSAAAPPSNQASPDPVPTFNLILCLSPAASRNRRNPFVRLFGVAVLFGSGGLTVRIPDRSGDALSLYQKTALNSSVVIAVVGNVRYASAAPLYALPV